VPKFSAREEVLTPPELHFVEVHGIRIRAYRALHRFHGLIGATEFVIRSCHLVEDLVIVLVIRVLGEQPFIESDRLKRALGSCVSAHYLRRRSASVAACRNLVLRSRAPLEFLIRFSTGGARSRGALTGSAGRFARRSLGGLWSGHRPRLAVACVYAVLLLELQVRETTDCLRCHRGLRCFIEEFPVVLHGL